MCDTILIAQKQEETGVLVSRMWELSLLLFTIRFLPFWTDRGAHPCLLFIAGSADYMRSTMNINHSHALFAAVVYCQI